MASLPSIVGKHSRGHQQSPEPKSKSVARMHNSSKMLQSEPQSRSHSNVLHEGRRSLSSRLTPDTNAVQSTGPSFHAAALTSLAESAEPRTAQDAPSVQLPWRRRSSIHASSSVEAVDPRMNRDMLSLTRQPTHSSPPQDVVPGTPTPQTPVPHHMLLYKTATTLTWCPGPGPNGPSLESVIRPIHPTVPVSLGPDGAAGPLVVPPVPAASEHGILYFEPRTMIRVGARWPQHPNESVGDVLRWLLQRGITVTWRVPRPPGLTVTAPPASDPDDFVLEAWSSMDNPSVRQYHMLTQALLARPHARQWILRESLAWRLALHYGPSHLLQDAMSGPSSTALVEGRGSEYNIPYATVGDLPSAAENAALVGQTSHGSLWPSLTLWEQSVAYTGEWHPSLERWLQLRLAELGAGKDLYLSDRAWYRHIRHALHSTERALGSTVGSAHRARELIGVYPECFAVSLLFFPSTAPASARLQI